MSDTIVTYSDNTSRSVKNLGWLMRYSQYVASIVLDPLLDGGALMVVTFNLPHDYLLLRRYPIRFETRWATYSLAREFSIRRRFSTATLTEKIVSLREKGYV